ncbi:MAG TPA: MBL fold metallo-hydrolase [Verrucomicrobiales bacterium]|nr:exonuclease [Verrucomicrobiales bacterium]HBE97566.1 MBL fold metallo-hydrolase [Verrucomicrobiales bacterium]
MLVSEAVSDFEFQSLNLRAEIGGNSYALNLKGETLLLDAGMHPKEEGADALPRYQNISFDSVDGIVVSHSHLDHIGTLPVAQRDQPSAPVYLTPGTAALGENLLHNSVNVMSSQATELGIKEYPLFHHREIEYLQERWMPREYERPFHLNLGDIDSASITFFDAGHIMGSAGVLIEKEDKTVFYTGDVHFKDHTLIKGARFPDLDEPDLLIMETTRGADERPTDYTRADEEERLAQCINNALDAGGSALIPVFAIGKTQEVLTMLDNFKNEGRIPEHTPIYIGGLSTKMTLAYDKFSRSTRRSRPGFEILRDMDVVTGKRSRKRTPIEYKPGAIFCLSSGMMSEKTVSNVFARGFLPNEKNSLLFVGYSASDTPGGVIRASNNGDLVRLDGTHKVPLNCEVHEFDFSGHARREELLDFAIKARPKKILLVHGDPPAAAWFETRLKKQLPDTEVIIPQPGIKISF